MPRFYGEEDEGFEAHKKPKTTRRPPAAGRELPPEAGNGTVAEIFPNQCSVRLDGQDEPRLFPYRLATLAVGGARRERSPVCVGDRVRVEGGVVAGRCERRNRLLRNTAAAKEAQYHALAANLDCLVIVAAAKDPGFTGEIVDRFLIAAASQGISPILCVNKTDLWTSGEPKPWELYAAVGAAVLETSAKNNQGIDALLSLLKGKAVAFCGHSGVGKTSLLRRLLGDDSFGRVGDVNAYSGKGKHTTTGAFLLHGPHNAAWIDTPGVMNFGLVDIDKDELLKYFPELAQAAKSCPAECPHEAEPCALLAFPRYPSYRRILGTL